MWKANPQTEAFMGSNPVGIGGERGIRTLKGLDKSVSYREFVAPRPIFAIRASAHYLKLLKSWVLLK
jgi:hypothetical protein